MPGKHVHFAANQYPLTPSPTYSCASLSSSGGPVTPPPLRYFGSPYACTPLPSLSCRIHPVLAVAESPLIYYDLTLPSTTVQCRSSVLPHVLKEPATMPPLPYMSIIVRSPHLPWKIEVVPSGKCGTHVTVEDVLHSIYRALRRDISEVEFYKYAPGDTSRRVTEAFKRRYERLPSSDMRSMEKKKGVKQVDFLEERTTLVGLSSTLQGPERWELHVA